jgi:hypothetical protein
MGFRNVNFLQKQEKKKRDELTHSRLSVKIDVSTTVSKEDTLHARDSQGSDEISVTDHDRCPFGFPNKMRIL